jgi:hypothetical protein
MYPLVWLSVAALAVASGIWYLRYVERRTLFYPTREIEFLPTELGLAFEDVEFAGPDGIGLHGWFVPAASGGATILYCHGNAGNISHRLERLKFFNQLGCNVFAFDYRGYGRSRGTPNEKGLYADAQAAYDYLLRRKIRSTEIIGYGESLGGAVIINLACTKPLAALILDSTFSCARDMAVQVYPFVPAWIFASRWNSVRKITSVSIPTLIIHSINDEIVPYAQARKLYAAAPGPKEFLQVRGGHNSGFYESAASYREKIADFIKRRC